MLTIIIQLWFGSSFCLPLAQKIFNGTGSLYLLHTAFDPTPRENNNWDNKAQNAPLLFVIPVFVNDLDDTKIVSKVGTAEDVKVGLLQDDLHKLFQWSQDWQMLFNTDKSKIIHFGFNNNESSYVLGTSTLCTVDEEKIIIDKTLKPSKQCAKAASAANTVLGMTKQTFLCKSKELILQLYKSLIRPKLEYCIQDYRHGDHTFKIYKYFRNGAKKGNQNDKRFMRIKV